MTGYNVGAGNRQDDHYVVRELDAHAWMEAYVAGQGWVEVDPTPEAECLSLHTNIRENWWGNFCEWMAAKWEDARTFLRMQFWRKAWFLHTGERWRTNLGWLLSTLGLLGVLLGIRRRWKRRDTLSCGQAAARADAGPLVGGFGDIIESLDRLFERVGHARPKWRAPLEHLASVPAHALSPSQRATSQRVVESVYRCAFGGAHISEDELRELRRAVQSLEPVRNVAGQL